MSGQNVHVPPPGSVNVAWLEFCHGPSSPVARLPGVDNASIQSARSPDPVAGIDVCDVLPDRFGSVRGGGAPYFR
jgi:hypothetical protein